MPKISVIVPVYKVEKYLNRCVDSILNQTFTDFELILVDDGSPDNCGKICDEYAAKDKRVVVIHKQNGGVSSARNAGLNWIFENSDSEWISFVDSDDYVDVNYFYYLYQNVQCDLVICGVINLINNSILTNGIINNGTIFMDHINYSELYKRYNLFSPYNKLFQVDIIKNKNVSYSKMFSWGEDAVFVSEYLKYVKNICVLDYKGYYYQVNTEKSLSTTIRDSIVDEISNSRLTILNNIEPMANKNDFEFLKSFIKKDIISNAAHFVKKVFFNTKVNLKSSAALLDRFKLNDYVQISFNDSVIYYDRYIQKAIKRRSSEQQIVCFRFLYFIARIRNRIRSIFAKLIKKNVKKEKS